MTFFKIPDDYSKAVQYLSKIKILNEEIEIEWKKVKWETREKQKLKGIEFKVDVGAFPWGDPKYDKLALLYNTLCNALYNDIMYQNGAYHGFRIFAEPKSPYSSSDKIKIRLTEEAVLYKYLSDKEAAMAFVDKYGTEILAEYKKSNEEPPSYLKNKELLADPNQLRMCINSRDFINFFPNYIERKKAEIAEQDEKSKNKPGSSP